jgi:hypothetical protein
MGAALPDDPGAPGTLGRSQWQASQDADNAGSAGDLQTKRWLSDRRLVFVADNGFAALELLAVVRGYVRMITRLRLDASLFRPAPKRRPGQRGRTPLKGRALPKPSTVLKNWKTVWASVIVSQWINAQQRSLFVATGTALWCHAGIAPVPIRWVLVGDPAGEHEPAASLSTDLDAQLATILGWFASRWRLETTFQEVRAHLGVETQRQWSDLAIMRTTPALLGLFSLIAVWADAWNATLRTHYVRTSPRATPIPNQRSVTPLPLSAASCGRRRVYPCPGGRVRPSQLQPDC